MKKSLKSLVASVLVVSFLSMPSCLAASNYTYTTTVKDNNKVEPVQGTVVNNTIIDELKFKNHFEEKKIINLSDKPFSGIVEFSTAEKLEGYDKIGYQKGFEKTLLTDTQRIPVLLEYFR